MDVNKPVLIETKKPTIGFNIARVLELTVKRAPIKISLIINNTFFLYKLLYFFL